MMLEEDRVVQDCYKRIELRDAAVVVKQLFMNTAIPDGA
jgi:hypothetical protein